MDLLLGCGGMSLGIDASDLIVPALVVLGIGVSVLAVCVWGIVTGIKSIHYAITSK